MIMNSNFCEKKIIFVKYEFKGQKTARGKNKIKGTGRKTKILGIFQFTG